MARARGRVTGGKWSAADGSWPSSSQKLLAAVPLAETSNLNDQFRYFHLGLGECGQKSIDDLGIKLGPLAFNNDRPHLEGRAGLR